MALWLLLVVAAQFINAIVAMIDKYIISSGTMPRPAAYAFYVSILSAFSVVIFFFDGISIPLDGIAIPSISNVSTPTLSVTLISLLAGLALFGALTSLFSALKRADASDVVPVVGASSAIAALILSFLLLDVALSFNFIWGFVLLVAGTLILSLYRFGFRTLWFAALSGALFGFHFVQLKLLFDQTNFDNAFFWSRMGIVAIAVALLLFPFLRRQLAVKSKSARKRAGILIIGNKILAGIASIMLLKAIEFGDVSIVQALGGLQFAFLLGLAAIFGNGLPQVCGERCTSNQLIHKLIAVSIIIVGFAVLFLSR